MPQRLRVAHCIDRNVRPDALVAKEGLKVLLRLAIVGRKVCARCYGGGCGLIARPRPYQCSCCAFAAAAAIDEVHLEEILKRVIRRREAKGRRVIGATDVHCEEAAVVRTILAAGNRVFN